MPVLFMVMATLPHLLFVTASPRVIVAARVLMSLHHVVDAGKSEHHNEKNTGGDEGIS